LTQYECGTRADRGAAAFSNTLSAGRTSEENTNRALLLRKMKL
jgi:hypothetical protein